MCFRKEKELRKKNVPGRLYSKCQEVFSLMPAADLYVFEESASILSRDPLMFTKMRQFLFETALVAQINGGKTENRYRNSRTMRGTE